MQEMLLLFMQKRQKLLILELSYIKNHKKIVSREAEITQGILLKETAR